VTNQRDRIRRSISSLSLGARWFLGSSLLLLVAVLPFGIYQARIIQARLEKQVHEQLRIRSVAVRDQVGQFLELQRHVVWSLARLVSQELRHGQEERVPSLLRETHEHEANLSALFVLDPEGTVLVADPPVRYNGEPVRGLSYADRDYFRSAIAGEDVAVGNVVMGRTTGTPTLGFAYALRDVKGEVSHVLTAGFDLAHFQRWLNAQVHDNDIQVLVLDERHRVIAGRMPTLADTSHIALYQMTNYAGLGIDHSGQEVFAVVATEEALRWSIVVMAPTARVQQAARQTIAEAAAVGLGAVVAAMLLSILVARSISRPIHQLIDGINVVTRGNLQHTVEVSAGPEFQQMATAFNNMTRAVSERNRQLEEAKSVLQTALARAEEATRHKSEFVANVSHELRTPLNAIVNIPSSLLQEYELTTITRCSACEAQFPEVPASKSCAGCGGKTFEPHEEVAFVGSAAEHRHFLKRLEQSSHHLLRVVNDLLDFSKIEAGYMELFRTPVNIEEVVDTAIQNMGAAAEERRIALLREVEAPSGSLEVDALRIQQVLLNLVSNALKFTEPGGTVTTRVRPDVHAGQLGTRFEVEDTGMGIPEDKLGIVFDSFRQVDGSHTRRRGGTGLGLAISKRLVELHGGTIGVKSTLDVGTTFWFWLPLSTVRTEAERMDAACATSLSSPSASPPA